MMRRLLAIALFAMAPLQAHAFCGFYVGKADASLFNEASQVILARDGGLVGGSEPRKDGVAAGY